AQFHRGNVRKQVRVRRRLLVLVALHADLLGLPGNQLRRIEYVPLSSVRGMLPARPMTVLAADRQFEKRGIPIQAQTVGNRLWPTTVARGASCQNGPLEAVI